MHRIAGALLLAAAAVAAVPVAGCRCPRCPLDTMDGIGVSLPSSPSSAERGALYSVFALLAAEAGPGAPEVQALDSALSGHNVVIGRFLVTRDTSHIRGYALLNDGRVALEERYARGALPDTNFLASRNVWPLIPYLYAAGYRMARGGTWNDSHAAAVEFTGHLADALDAKKHSALLPPGTDIPLLARALRYWQANF
jgi:hypothetical protein